MELLTRVYGFMPAMLRNGLIATSMAGVILVAGAVGMKGEPSYADRLKQILEPVDPCRKAAMFEPMGPTSNLTCGSE